MIHKFLFYFIFNELYTQFKRVFNAFIGVAQIILLSCPHLIPSITRTIILDSVINEHLKANQTH